MAKIWLLESGKIQEGDSVDEKSLDFCFDLLGLRQSDFRNPQHNSIVIPGNPRSESGVVRPGIQEFL